eukprot:gb/GECG01010319.1/.p1 GENE.gb/GECG01010319.1/~~gb/GECG01010319.1/.p1  ORF type:complete len:1051 (+),score=110.54 gb/GECG01010319.1/:1-3153(+)
MTRCFKKNSLGRKLFAANTGATLTAVVCGVLIYTALVLTSWPRWIEEVENLMISAQTDQLRRLAGEKAQYTDVYMKRIKGELDGVSVYAEDIIRGAVPFRNRDAVLPRYSTLRENPESVPGWTKTEMGFHASFNTSGWYQCRADGNLHLDCNGTRNESELTPASLENLELSDGLEIYFKALKVRFLPNAYFAITFADNGLVRQFPFQDLRNFLDWKIDCVTQDPSFQRRGFEPRCRPWWALAEAANASVQFTDPYSWIASGLDTSVLGISAARPVYNYTGEDGSIGIRRFPSSDTPLVGVTSFEPEMGTLNDLITEPILDNGYGYLMDRSNGKALLHPDQLWNSRTRKQATSLDRSVLGLEFGNVRSKDAEGFKNTFLKRMINGDTGSGEFERNGEAWFISYQGAPSGNYSLAVVVPKDDIRAPFHKVHNRIFMSIFVQIAIIGVVTVALIGTLFVYAKKVGDMVKWPMDILLDLVRRVNSGELHEEEVQFVGLVSDSHLLVQELAALDKVLRFMYLSVKAGQSAFLSGDLAGGIKNFRHLIQMYTRLGHTKGVGVCNTNLGAIYTTSGQYRKAIECYNSSVKNAQELLADFNNKECPAKEEGAPAESKQSIEFQNPIWHDDIEEGMPEEYHDLLYILAKRQLNLAKAMSEKAKFALCKHWPERFGMHYEKRSSRYSDEPISLEQVVADLKEASYLTSEALDNASRSGCSTMEIRCDVVRILSLLAEVSRYCEEEHRFTLGDYSYEESLGRAKEAFTRLSEIVEDAQLEEDYTEAYFGQRLRILAAKGNILMAKNNSRGALKAFHKALTKCPNVRASHLREVAHDFAAVMHYCGYSSQARLTLSKLNRSSCFSKEFTIAIDASARKKPNPALDRVFEKILELYDSHITEDDIVSAFTFGSAIHYLVPRGMKGSSDEASNKRNALCEASLQNTGGCACYDGIWQALDSVQCKPGSNEKEEDKIILCVVNSEDKGSHHSSRELIARLRNNSKIRLIVVALKQLPNQKDLQAIACSNDKGTLVEACDDISDIDKAFGKVYATLPRTSLHLEGI